MTYERMQARIDAVRETLQRWRIAQADFERFRGEFGAELEAYNKASKGQKRQLAVNLDTLWKQERGAMRIAAELAVLYERARAELDQAYYKLGAELGERVPEQFVPIDRQKPLI